MFAFVYRPMGKKYPLCENGTMIENATEYVGLCLYNLSSVPAFLVDSDYTTLDSELIVSLAESTDDGNHKSL